MKKIIFLVLLLLLIGGGNLLAQRKVIVDKQPFMDNNVKTLVSGDSLHFWKPLMQGEYTMVDFINQDTASSYHPDSLRIDVVTSLGDTLYNVDFKVWVGDDTDGRYISMNLILLTESQIKSVLILSPDVYSVRVRWLNVFEYALRQVKTNIRIITF